MMCETFPRRAIKKKRQGEELMKTDFVRLSGAPIEIVAFSIKRAATTMMMMMIYPHDKTHTHARVRLHFLNVYAHEYEKCRSRM